MKHAGLQLSWVLAASCCLNAQSASSGPVFRNPLLSISTECGTGCLWRLSPASGGEYSFAPPEFSINGKTVVAELRGVSQLHAPLRLPNGVMEVEFEGSVVGQPTLKLTMQFQLNDETPVVRFRYLLRSADPQTLSKAKGEDQLTYFRVSLAGLPHAREINLSTFDELSHSYLLTEQELGTRYFDDYLKVMGPIVTATDERRSLLVAYEHGSQLPDAFLHYELSPDRLLSLSAVKGNYLTGQLIDNGHPLRTIWFEAVAVEGTDQALASTFRRYILKYMSASAASRKPYIFYNTWNFQERNKWWNGKPYLESMNLDRILKEIDTAHRMGIDVFVLDTGWYEKTGDWTISKKRFPDGLKTVKAKLDGYGMKLGLWFGPTTAAVSSRIALSHPEWQMSMHGKRSLPYEVWETEKSVPMCLVSDYSDAFAHELIRLGKEVGVTYFKWDAIGQYGCNDPHHQHGNENNSEEERGNSYAFQLVRRMSAVADKVSAAIPGAIVDFDITEGGRAVGLGFLSSGKYFLINNGPYYMNYDIPVDQDRSNVNMFFYKGQARSWIARSPLTFDKWIPSTLFLTHYFPDDPEQWQEVTIGSLILGQNGIWGDLLNVSSPGVEYLGKSLGFYKQVSTDITESDPVTSGIVGGSPEIHEKLSNTTGRGAVVIFATTPGRYSYVTEHRVNPSSWSTSAVDVAIDAKGRAKITADFTKPGAKAIFFGVKQ